MKWLGIMVTAALVAATPGYGGAQSPMKSPQTEGTQATGDAVKGQAAGQGTIVTPDERQAYEKKVAADLGVIDTKIGDLRVKTTKVPSQQKRLTMLQMQSLYTQAVAARTQLGNLAKSQGDAWNQAKDKLDRSMQELTRNLEAAENKYK